MTLTFETGVVVNDRFELIKRLGRGSTGVVWSAKDRTDDGRVAIKILHDRVFHHEVLLEQLHRELEVLETLHHPHIARPIHFSGEPPAAYLAMELVEGPTLDQLLAEHAADDRQLPWEFALPIIEQLLSALIHAHGKFIVHRDLKPQNIALASTLRGPSVKVLDFGIAKFMEGGLFDATTLGRRLGSLFYMSPEQLRGDAADLRSDVFALGVMCFEVLTMKRAWPRDEDGGFIPAFSSSIPRVPANSIASMATRVAQEPRPIASALRPELPASIDAMLVRAMAIEPADRYASVRELRDALIPVLSRIGGLEPTIVANDEPDTTLQSVPYVPPVETDTRLVPQLAATTAAPAISTVDTKDTRSVAPTAPMPRAVEPRYEGPAEVPPSYWILGAIAFASALIVIALGILFGVW